MDIITQYAKDFKLNEASVRKAVAVSRKVQAEWEKRLGSMSEEEYDVLEGTLIKLLAKKK